MGTDAVVTMLVAMAIIWGGLVASIAYAVKVARGARVRGPKSPGGPADAPGEG
jgi:hypothetical protein